MTLRIRHVNPNDLKPHPDNPRVIDDDAYRRLTRIIEQFGFVEPLVVNRRTGLLVGGHQRRCIALDIGIDKVPVVEIDVDEDEERALLVALNNDEAQGRFDPDGLTRILEGLADGPMLEATGFDFSDYQELRLTTVDAVKEGREGTVKDLPDEATICRPGDVWRLGRHTLVIGDAADPDVWDTLPGRPVMCFTDPPYGIDYQGWHGRPRTPIANDTGDGFADWIRGPLHLIAANVEGAIYICHSAAAFAAIMDAAAAVGLHHSSTIVWAKHRIGFGRSDYQWQWEAIFYGWPDGRKRWWCGDRTQGNVWHYRRPARSKAHPTMKPVELVERAIRNSSPPDGLVADPFAGSGTTLAAAENLNRRAWLVEIDPRYGDVIIERWRSLVDGTEPELIHRTETAS